MIPTRPAEGEKIVLVKLPWKFWRNANPIHRFSFRKCIYNDNFSAKSTPYTAVASSRSFHFQY